jgi:hypothetical protein
MSKNETSGAVSHEEALRLSERARAALDGDVATHGADPYWSRLSWDLAAVVDGWICDSADEWTRDDEGAKTASGRFDAAFLIGRIQRVLRDRLGAEGQNSIASPANPAPDARQAVVEAARRIEMLARGLYMAGATSTGAWPPWLERSPNLAVGTVHRDPLRFAAELHAIAAALAAAPPPASQGGETVPMHGTEGGEHG